MAEPATEIKTTTVGAEANGADEPSLPNVLPLLPVRDLVLFPGMPAPLHVGQERSIRLVDDVAARQNRYIAVAALRDPAIEIPGPEDCYPVGTAAYIRMMLKLPDGTIRLMIQGLQRIRLLETEQTEPYLKVRIQVLEAPDAPPDQRDEIEALRRSVGELFTRWVQLAPNVQDEAAAAVQAIPDPQALADFIGFNLPIANSEKQELLETLEVNERLRKLLALLTRETQMLELQGQIQSQVSSELSKTQRDYYLREQMKAIQKELGESDMYTADVDDLRARLLEAKLPAEAQKEAERELDRLSRMPPAAPEYTVSRTYVEWILSLPWNTSATENLDIPAVKKVLDEDHYGLPKVKDRILEILSVRKFHPEGGARQPILCFVGPPGVGKTSLGRSIARAIGRPFVRFSLGGVRDEAEIRGHRRTYIGALPGQIIQGLRRAEANNPVFMLDEVDKMGMDFRGDPTSALLEVLDPEQNYAFRDHYLDVPFDLSKVLFITTANLLDPIPPPLRDRMEVLELAGYTEEEKLHIARQHLIPRQMKEHGLTEQNVAWRPDALPTIIRGYTREAGVRNLEREIGSICRKATREFAEGRTEVVPVDAEQVRKYLGMPRFEHEEIEDRASRPGVATGLFWTPVGGDVLFIEATKMPGEKGLMLTGMLGEVMKESAQAALSYVRSHAQQLGIDPEFYRNVDIHVHVPAGAIPKDGPSAGITMTTAIASLLTGKCVKPLLAMTGEITLSGRVLPVGGIKEKVLGAHRAGIRTIIMSDRNRNSVDEDVPAEVRQEVKFLFAHTMDQVLEWALDSCEDGKDGSGRQPAAP